MHAVLSEVDWVIDVLSLGDLTDKGALWMPEEIIDSAIACGLSPEEAIHAYRTIWYVVHGPLVFRRAEARRAAGPGRKPFFPALVTEDDAGELPCPAALSTRWAEVTAAYDVAAQPAAAVVDGLLARRVSPA